ncbi:hypothetical protein [Bacillus sp. 1NLA3E]|uniref:hypothetical protein n=1 Tax=Bacillus sp. 1NLA3E TaxID=666686 RepID=UPI000247E669|nr:hypothetical protein [Bacillus sp. 1NLA3E]AGK52010.1 hypothetical protein B1NLA3E_01130 [Bacillus sp. 1NLA3E]
MGILLESVKSRKKIKRGAPLEKKMQYVLDELKSMNVNISRTGKPVESLDYDELKEEWVFATILSFDVESPENKFF